MKIIFFLYSKTIHDINNFFFFFKKKVLIAAILKILIYIYLFVF